MTARACARRFLRRAARAAARAATTRKATRSARERIGRWKISSHTSAKTPSYAASPFRAASRSARPRRSRGWHGCSKRPATFEELAGSGSPAQKALLETLDILIDGEFILAQRNLDLRFRGSANQRILDVPRSLAAGKAVWCTAERWVGAREA